jgi:hypothetical protein
MAPIAASHGLALATIAATAVACGMLPVDADPRPFPAHIADRYSAPDAGYIVLEDAPPPEISWEEAVELARGFAASDAHEGSSVAAVIRRGLVNDPQAGTVTATVWLVAFESAVVIGVDDQTGGHAVTSCF